MAFSITRNYNNTQEKFLTAYVKSITPNGQTPLTALAYTNLRLDQLETEVIAAIKVINDSRRADALNKASTPTLNSVNTTLSLVNYEDLP